MTNLLVESGRAKATRQIAAAAASKLRETVRLLSMAEELATVGHWRLDLDDGEIELSPEASRICGLARGRVLGISEALRRLPPSGRLQVLRAALRALAGARDVSCKIQLRSGRAIRHVIIQMTADDGEKRAGTCLFGVVRDVTDKMIYQQSLIAARDEAEAATRAKSEFLATMSHEIRTPMTGVMGMIDLLRDCRDEREREHYLEVMKQSADMLLSVLDSVLDLSKAESGRLEIEPRPFDLEKLARRTADIFRNSASKKGLGFDLDLDCGQSPLVDGDPVRIQQVISNLISNAVKFTQSGRIIVSVRAVPLGPDAQRWRFSISDTGIGIGDDERKRLFEPFVQLGDRRFGGTGLGLAISRRIVEAMGGRTGLESAAGLGSSFWFEVDLPVAREAPSRPATAIAADARQGSLSILVAEDNPTNQMLIAAMLRRLGHQATCVDNGRLAVESARSRDFDAILMDMQMPEMDGAAATRAIRKSGGHNATVPIIALTADAAPERRRFYENIGLSGFMTKPLNFDGLKAQLATIAAAPQRTAGHLAPCEIDPGRLAELTLALGRSKVEQLLTLLSGELASRPALLKAAAIAGDHRSVRAHAHSLKGAIANFGGQDAVSAAEALQSCPKGKQMTLAIRRFDREIERFSRALERLLGRDIFPERRSA